MTAPTAAATDLDGIVVYWRPGCPFCATLRAGLQRAGLAFREVNIWDDPKAAEFVRSIARGNETVPTVSVGAVSLVNPSTTKVLELIATGSPDHLPTPGTSTRRRLFRRRSVRGS